MCALVAFYLKYFRLLTQNGLWNVILKFGRYDVEHTSEAWVVVNK
jgi:hypothetical protein